MKKPTKKKDRRIERTRAQLRHAFLSVMMEKGYDAVTVQDIIDRAGVARSTFYMHFDGKDALHESSFVELSALLRARAAEDSEGGARPLAFSLAMFEHADEHRRLYRALVGRRGGTVVLSRMKRLVSELIREELTKRAGARAVPLDAIVEYCAGSFFALLSFWLDHKTGLEPAEIDAAFRTLTLPGLEAAFGSRHASRR